jgi:predicted SprT family Zn-dependent metalloprotease
MNRIAREKEMKIVRDLMMIASELLKYYPESVQDTFTHHYRCPADCGAWMRRFPPGQEKIYICPKCKQKWEMQK